ncbi:Peptidyl-prolyl cis-trans isomerase-like 3 [Phlyctochytrium planicorne]|nr:Peptidyl-prolyl cis-trans isomerase-like 3 [Phlyctochytrium planicorne]
MDVKLNDILQSHPKSCGELSSPMRKVLDGYYNQCLFHRNIKGFMVQTGDPTGTGKGGTSIWQRPFEDEIKAHLKHNARGIVSMANKGPDTNLSQFFITYAKQPHLDSKYTVFGKYVTGGHKIGS